MSKKNFILDFAQDVISLPFLVFFGPIVGNPVGTKMLIVKSIKVIITLIVFIIIGTVFFISLGQRNEELRTFSSEASSYVTEYNRENKTLFSESMFKFINKYEGIKVADPNGYFVGECVSLVKQWQSYLQVPFGYWVGNYPTPAFNAYLNGNPSIAFRTEKYNLITINKEQVKLLNAGDLVILTGSPSHTAIATGRVTENQYEVFEQNAPKTGDAPNLSFYNHKTFIGAIRYNPK